MAIAGNQADSELVLHDWQGANRSRAAKYLDKRLAETSSNYKSMAVATFFLTTAYRRIWLVTLRCYSRALVDNWRNAYLAPMDVATCWSFWGWITRVEITCANSPVSSECSILGEINRARVPRTS
jgi:hypothetical protein